MDGGAEYAAAAAAAAALGSEEPPPSVAEGGLRQSAGLRAYNWKLRAFLDEVASLPLRCLHPFHCAE